MKHEFALIDEAGQTMEPLCVQILLHLDRTVGRCALCGDPHQLPAAVNSMSAKHAGLDISLLERLMDDAGFPSAQCMLCIQYRMLPEISRWPNQHFYKGQLANWCETFSKSELVDLSTPIPGFSWPHGIPLAFVHVESSESCSRES